MAGITGNAVYQQIKANGWLARNEFRVYDTIYHHGPLTDREIAAHLGLQRDSASPRVRGLLAKKVIMHDGNRACKITGKTVRTTKVTGNLPFKPKRKASPKQLVKSLTEALEFWLKQIDRSTLSEGKLETHRVSRQLVVLAQQT